MRHVIFELALIYQFRTNSSILLGAAKRIRHIPSDTRDTLQEPEGEWFSFSYTEKHCVEVLSDQYIHV